MEEELAMEQKDAMRRLKEDRDEALALLDRVEASRNELARQQGHYKGRIAKSMRALSLVQLEGAISSTEKHILMQNQENMAFKAQIAQMQMEHASIIGQLDITPDRCRADKELLQAQAKKAVKLVYNAESRMKELHQAVEYEAQQRKELTEFASLELSATTESERVLAASLSDLATQLTGHAAALSSTEAELKSTQAALAQAEEEVQHLRYMHLSSAKAAEKAQKELKILRGTCQQLTHDRMQSISNVHKAESEVDLIHQANEQMFRYLNYVQQRLSSHIADLQGSPELMKLLRDLHVWVAREGSGRCAMPTTPSMSGSSAGKTSAATPSFRLQAARTPLMASCHSRINP